MNVLEIKTEKELEAWFEKRPPAVAQVVAVRAALRAFPYVMEAKEDKKFASKIVIPAFKSLTTSWALCKYQVNDYKRVADAVRSAMLISKRSAYSRSNFLASHAARAVGDAAHAPRSATRAVIGAAFVPNNSDFHTFWEESLHDCTSLEDAIEHGDEAENAARDLVGQRLWRAQSMPEETLELWNELKDFLSNAGDNWQVWRDWYQARLDGGKTIDVPSDLLETLDVGIATLDEKLWKQGPAVVNAKIQELMDEAFEGARERKAASPKEIDDAGEDLEQRPSISSFGVRDGKIVAEAFEVESVDALRPDLWDETLSKAQDTKERLQRTQAPDHVIKALEQLIKDLGSSVDEVNPGRILMRSRTLDAIWAAYNTVEYRDELVADAYVLMEDLIGSVGLLKASYSEILKIEAAQVAQQLARDDVNEVKHHIEKIIEAAEQSDVVDATAVEALKYSESAINNIEAAIADARNDSVRAAGVKNRSEAVAQWVVDIRNFCVASVRASKNFLGDAKTRVRSGLLKGIEKSAEGVPPASFSGLVAYLVDPLYGLGTLLAVTFSGLAKQAKKVSEKDDEEDDDDEGLTSV